MKKFKYIVSLGHFCSPAMEFERIEKRQFSLPFDWLITQDFSLVIELINNNFKDFLNTKYLFQLKKYPQYYRNVKYNIDFYHDFSPFISFDSQIDKVSEKYNRRIKRFYNTIKQPTLFVRYITENDIGYISASYQLILKSIKTFNSQNDIIFISNDDIHLNWQSDISVYYVKKDSNDTVSRVFLRANDDLREYILSNVESVTSQKNKQENKLLSIIKKIYMKIRIKMNLTYRHDKQC